MNWTPDYSGSGNYEFKITGSEGDKSDFKIFSIVVNNVDAPPVLDTISNQSVDENNSIIQINAGDGGDDKDFDNDIINYTCHYDTTVDGAVSDSLLCKDLAGVSFEIATGIMNWTPDFSGSGNYEFKITGSEGDKSDFEIFSIIVNNVDAPPILDTISNQSVNENDSIIQINAGDGGDDKDLDNDSINYTCHYDTTVDGAVSDSSSCANLTGIIFNILTGIMTWTPDFSQSGFYEFKITGYEGDLHDFEIFSITVNNVNRFISTWRIGDVDYGDGDLTVSLPLVGGYNYNFIVDWGDGNSGTINAFNDTDIHHTYGSAGDYTIKIFGIAEAWKFGNGGDKDKILSVSMFENLGWINLEGAFYGCSKLISFTGGVSNSVINMRSMFQNASSLTSFDFSNFDTSSVTDMSYLFSGVSSITTLDVSKFNTSSVKNMKYMFANNPLLSSLDLTDFDTSSVTDMSYMFANNPLLSSFDVSGFNTNFVENMEYMFYNNLKLTSLDVSKFNTSSVKSMRFMFCNASLLTSLDVSNFTTWTAVV